MVKMEKKINVANMYDQIAPIYAEYSLKKKAYIDSIDRIILLALNPSTRLLDVGAGDGNRLRNLMDMANINKATAIELSSEMAKRCQLHKGIQVHQTPIEQVNVSKFGRFDVITALWNVLGHVGSKSRVTALSKMSDMLSPKGVIWLDVNNRHNASAYGHMNVLWRRFIDSINFKEKRGDSYYYWKMGEQSIPSYGHLFTPDEFERLAKRANLKITQCNAVNYVTGNISASKYKGQLLYRLERK